MIIFWLKQPKIIIWDKWLSCFDQRIILICIQLVYYGSVVKLCYHRRQFITFPILLATWRVKLEVLTNHLMVGKALKWNIFCVICLFKTTSRSWNFQNDISQAWLDVLHLIWPISSILVFCVKILVSERSTQTATS